MLRVILLGLALFSSSGAWASGAPPARQSAPEARLDPVDQDAQIQAAFVLPNDLRAALDARGLKPTDPFRDRIQALIDFMLADDGLGLQYQEQPTYDIAESYSRRRVNCLSFTLMFVALARASGLRARVQASDEVLESWRSGDLLFRTAHVNAVVDGAGGEYKVDVGWLRILASLPARALSDQQAIALFHNNRAMEHLRDGDVDAARADAQAALALESNNAILWSNAGVVERLAGRNSVAEQYYLRALGIRGSSLAALGNLVSLYRSDGQDQLVQEYAGRLQSAQERDPFTQFQFGQTMLQSGDAERAAMHFRKATQMLPTEPSFYRNLSEAYRLQGKQYAAERAARRAVQLETQVASLRGIRLADASSAH